MGVASIKDNSTIASRKGARRRGCNTKEDAAEDSLSPLEGEKRGSREFTYVDIVNIMKISRYITTILDIFQPSL